MSYQRDYQKRLNVGLVGIGSHSYRNLLPAMNYLPVCLKAVCNRSNLELAQNTAKQYGCNYYQSTAEMYEKENLDAVFICVSPQAHPKLAIEALHAGLHVWIEKPAAMRAFEIQEMIDHRKDKIVVTGYKKAFMPVTEKAIEIVNSPKYGNLKSILAIYPMSIPSNGKEILENRTQVNWLTNGVHSLSFLMAVGGKVDSVTSICNSEGHGSFVLQFKNGVIGNFHLASGPQPLESYSLYGDKWHINIWNNNKFVLQRGINFEYGKNTTFAPEGDDSGAVVWEAQNCQATLENKALFTQGMYNEMKYFCDCIIENKKPDRGSLEFSLELMKIYEAGLLSNGKTVVIE